MRHPHKRHKETAGGFGVRLIDSAHINKRDASTKEKLNKIKKVLRKPIELPFLYEGDSPVCCNCWSGVVLVSYDMHDRPKKAVCVKCGQKFTVRLLLRSHKRTNQKGKHRSGKRFREREAAIVAGQSDLFKL